MSNPGWLTVTTGRTDPAQQAPQLFAITARTDVGALEPFDIFAVGPAFGDALDEIIAGLPHAAVLEALLEGVREGGATPPLVRVRRSSDVAFIGHEGPASPARG